MRRVFQRVNNGRRVLNVLSSNHLHRRWTTSVAPSSASSSISQPASAAPAVPPADDSGGSGWAPLLRAFAGILFFGVPWWLLSQLRDDDEFRSYCEDVYPDEVEWIFRLAPYFAPPKSVDYACADGNLNPSGTTRLILVPSGRERQPTTIVEVPLSAAVQTAVSLSRGECAALLHADNQPPICAPRNAENLAAQAVVIMPASVFGREHTVESLARLRSDLASSSEDARALAAPAEDRFVAHASNAGKQKRRLDLSYTTELLKAWQNRDAAHWWSGAGEVRRGWFDWRSPREVAVDLDAPCGGDEIDASLWNTAPPVRRVALTRDAVAVMDDILMTLVLKKATAALPPPPPPPAPAAPPAPPISAEYEAWLGLVSNIKGVLGIVEKDSDPLPPLILDEAPEVEVKQ